MACCGQKRSQIAVRVAPRRQNTSPSPPPSLSPSPSPSRSRSPSPSSSARVAGPGQSGRPLVGILVRYLESAAFAVVGPRTGRTYRFSASSRVQLVAAPDAAALLAMRQFRRQ